MISIIPMSSTVLEVQFNSPFEFVSLHIISKNVLTPLHIENLFWSRERVVSLTKILGKLLFVYYIRGSKGVGLKREEIVFSLSLLPSLFYQSAK